MVLAEAMSEARPFVTTPVGGIPELAREGGMMVPVGDELALAQRLTELLSDRALARELGDRGQRFCRDTRSLEVVGAQLDRIYAIASRA
jgi:glycosyltransferase involved in cell wall biosynthesis